MTRLWRVLLVLSLTINVLGATAGVWYIHERGARPIAEDVGLVEPHRPAYGFYASERFTDLPGAPVTVVGDSQVERGPWSELLGVPVAMRGQSGARIAEVTGWVPTTVPRDTGRAIVWAGSNDVLDRRTPTEIEGDMAALLAAIHERAPRAHIVVLSLPPLEWAAGGEVPAANRAIRAAAVTAGAAYVDVTPALEGLLVDDGVHVTAVGYKAIMPLLR